MRITFVFSLLQVNLSRAVHVAAIGISRGRGFEEPQAENLRENNPDSVFNAQSKYYRSLADDDNEH